MNKYDIAYLLFHGILRLNPEKGVGEAGREGWDIYYTLTGEVPEGKVCSYCGRDNFFIDDEGYGPCGCM